MKRNDGFAPNPVFGVDGYALLYSAEVAQLHPDAARPRLLMSPIRGGDIANAFSTFLLRYLDLPDWTC